LECLGLSEISFDDLASRMYGDGRRWPIAGALELTERCNLQCVHCYVRQPAGDVARRERELTGEQWFGVLDQLVEAGCLKLLMTGGEVLLRPDFSNIFLYAKRKGLLVSVFTNGTLLTPEVADLFFEWPPLSLSITVYGATEETYERMTGVPGSYRRFRQGIELLHERGVPFQLKTVLTTLNHHEFGAMKRLAEGYGLKLKHDAVLWPRMDGSTPVQQLRLSPEQVVEYDFDNPEEARDWVDLNRDRLGAVEYDTVYNCGAGLKGFYINAYGQLGLCLMARATQYSVVQGSFAEGWNTVLPQLRFQKATRTLECQSCEIAHLCARCPAFAAWENGDPETVVDYVCQIAHQRAEAFGIREFVTV